MYKLIILLCLTGCSIGAQVGSPKQVTKKEILDELLPELNKVIEAQSKVIMELQYKIFPERFKQINK